MGIGGAQPTGLYGWIQSNDGRSTGLFLGFLLAIQLVAPLTLVGPLLLVDVDHAPFFGWRGYLLRYAPIVLLASIAWFAVQLWWHVETVKRAVDFHFVDDSDEPRLCRIIEPLIILTGLPVPFVGVIESEARNAFACGIGRKKAVVVVTRGLIDALDDAELASVLAHELSHIRNGDIRLMAAANIFMSGLTRLHRRNALRFTWVHALLVLAVPAVLPLSLAGGLLGRLALRGGQVSRLLIASSREFIADAEAAGWTQNPAALASALLKIDGRHRVACARAEDDAMMIAGDSEGSGATHPTIAHRVAALARVTGSMVFNAPSAPRDSDWTADTPRETVERMAFGRKSIASRAIARVRQGDDENFLGLTFNATIALMATIGALIAIHADTLGNPRALAAKFDLRPIAIMIGTPVACELSPFSTEFRRKCAAGKTQGAYRDFEGQSGTLAGYLADLSRARREQGIINADVNFMSLGGARVRVPYLGQSGRLRGVSVVRWNGRNGYVQDDGAFAYDPPRSVVIAEINQLGCFPGSRAPLTTRKPIPLTERYGDSWSIDRLRSMADALSFKAERASASPVAALEYLAGRKAVVGTAYDIYGAPGLAFMQTVFATEPHALAISRFEGELARQPGKIFTPQETAEFRQLIRNPAAFVPCRSLSGTV